MRLADNQKDIESITLVSTYYFTGRVIEPDYKSVYELREKSALLGDRTSQTLLASFSISCEYYPFNYTEGLAWLLVAKETSPLEGYALEKYEQVLKSMPEEDIKSAKTRARNLIQFINNNT